MWKGKKYLLFLLRTYKDACALCRCAAREDRRFRRRTGTTGAGLLRSRAISPHRVYGDAKGRLGRLFEGTTTYPSPRKVLNVPDRRHPRPRRAMVIGFGQN